MAEIHTATERGRSSRVKEILDDDADSVHLRDDLGYQPLHLAAWHGRTAIAKLLLGAGAKVNAKGERGKTPLHIAVWSQKPKVVELLLAQGADTTIEDDTGATPLYLAASTHDQPMCDVLQRSGVPVDSRSMIYLVGPDAAIAAFAKGGVPITPETAQQIIGDAVRVGSTELLTFLLQHGADANKPSFGSSPLLQAVSEHSENIVRVLLQHGADVNVRDHVGRPILRFCNTYGAPTEIIGLLKEHGATE
jgi:uncharacterized protein